jgi:sugar phosphate isomerase/epimerase
MSDFSYQLYSSRNFPPLSDTLSMLAETGYTQVEGYGALFSDDTDLGALKASLDASGLTMPTAHIGLDVLSDRPARALEIVRTLGIEAVFGPFLQAPDRPTNATGWEAFGKRLAELGKPIQEAGCVFGWHNHAFEFERVEGELPMDLILQASDTLMIELDVAWCVKGGEDPVAWIEANGTRIAAAHIKDIAPEGEALDEDGWADVGTGTMDWAAIMPALRQTPCRWFIAEHDNPNDHHRFASRSLAAMRSF